MFEAEQDKNKDVARVGREMRSAKERKGEEDAVAAY